MPGRLNEFVPENSIKLIEKWLDQLNISLNQVLKQFDMIIIVI